MDLRRLKEQASRLSAEGRFERAEVLYRQMLTVAPRDPSLWLRHAELLKRLARTESSVSSYRMAARLLMDAGHAARAIACLKMALELLPDDIDLVTDIIRFELRQLKTQRASHLPPPPLVDHLQAMRAEHEQVHETTPQLLALPMFVSSESRLTALVPALVDPLPPPPASAPRIPVEVESPLQRWPQVRRLSETEVALKASPFAKWVVVTSFSAIEVRFFDDFPVDEDAPWLE